MLANETAMKAVPVFAALGDQTRLALVSRLLSGESRSISQLRDGASITRQAITKHLQVLEQAGLVVRARVGRESQFRLRPEALAPAQDFLQRASAQWDEAINRLEGFLERSP